VLNRRRPGIPGIPVFAALVACLLYDHRLLKGDNPMNVLIDICVVPMGVGVSVSKYVVECQRIFEAAGLNHEMHSYGTNVEGEWDKVMAAVKQCHEKMHEMGAPRCGSTLRVGTRNDREQSMRDKLDSVYKKMEI
jgi:uncharacterized protein (TIGR00106 family)